MDALLDRIQCPRCQYQNPTEAHHCGMCGYVPPRASEEEILLAKAQPGTASFRRPPTDRIERPGTSTIRKPTDRFAKDAASRQESASDRIDRTTPSGGQAVLPPEIAELRRDEQVKEIKRSVYKTGRLIRHALVGVIALGAICAVRESLFSLTAVATVMQAADTAKVAVFCLLFGLPIGFITAWHGGGAFRGLFVAGALFTVEPWLLRWFLGPDRVTAWSYQDLMAGLLAGFCVGLFIEIDR